MGVNQDCLIFSELLWYLVSCPPFTPQLSSMRQSLKSGFCFCAHLCCVHLNHHLVPWGWRICISHLNVHHVIAQILNCRTNFTRHTRLIPHQNTSSILPKRALNSLEEATWGFGCAESTFFGCQKGARSDYFGHYSRCSHYYKTSIYKDAF